MMFTADFLKAIPKTDLHVHLDGSLRPLTLVDLAKESGVKLPSQTEEGLFELVFKENYLDLPEYLQGFFFTTAVMQTPEQLERIACEFVLDNAAEGVRYVEVRFAPQLHINEKMDMEQVLIAVDRGLARGRDEVNGRMADPAEPRFAYGIIVCSLRFFTSEHAWYYKTFMSAFAYAKPREVFGLASDQLVRAAVAIRDRHGIPIVGIDLAGAEAGYPPIDHRSAYQYAHKHFMKKTVHAGEAWGPESIFQAITELHANRIGHGLHLFDKGMIRDPEIDDRDTYINQLSEFIADQRITMEVCLTSNRQTTPELADISKHSLADMLGRNLSVTLCTDNRLVSRTTVTDEIALAVKTFPIDSDMLKNIIIYGFKRSFFPGSYTEKRRYVRGVIDYYEKVCLTHGVASG
jgi:adenosine deaminase